MLVTVNVFPSSPILFTLMTKALRSSDTSVLKRTTRRYILEGSILHSHHREYIKSETYKLFQGDAEIMLTLCSAHKTCVTLTVIIILARNTNASCDYVCCAPCKLLSYSYSLCVSVLFGVEDSFHISVAVPSPQTSCSLSNPS
jgi:hypothetical protein